MKKKPLTANSYHGRLLLALRAGRMISSSDDESMACAVGVLSARITRKIKAMQ